MRLEKKLVVEHPDNAHLSSTTVADEDELESGSLGHCCVLFELKKDSLKS